MPLLLLSKLAAMINTRLAPSISQLWVEPARSATVLTPLPASACSSHQVRILADATLTRFDVELAAPTSTSYSAMVLGSGQHKLAPLFALLFRRSTVQHPLLAGALGEARRAVAGQRAAADICTQLGEVCAR